MKEVRLHGALAQRFGKCWNLDVSTPAEAVRAIDCARPGFKQAILDLGQAGNVFRVRSKDHDYSKDDLNLSFGSVDRIDIIPIVRGASAGIRFVAGAVLVAAAFYFGGPTAGSWATTAAFSAGVSLMLGSVVEWLTPKPKRPEDNSKNSWTFSGPSNTTEQGIPVPIIYGEVLTGSIVVSAGISVSEVTTGYSAAGVTIGGNVDLSGSWETPGVHTHRLTLSASLADGRIADWFAWSHSGFPGAIAKRWVQQGTAVGILELDYNVSSGPASVDVGSVTLAASVRNRGDVTYGIVAQTVYANANISVWNKVK